MENINVLIACEESQTVCKAFRDLGINAYSCDLVPSSGGHPEWHFKQDVLEVINDKGGTLETGEQVSLGQKNWDLMVAHPPCTYLSSSGARWFYHPEDKHLPTEQRRPHPKFPRRAQDREEAAEFFIKLAEANIEHIAVENPVGYMSTIYRKPEQIVQPYQFGDSASKKTCLWLKNLPSLKPTNIVDKGEFITYKSGNKMPKWYADALTNSKNAEERRKIRSKTFDGIAKAMAEQWSKAVIEGR